MDEGMVWTRIGFTTESSRSTIAVRRFGTLGGGVLLGFCFFKPRHLGRSPRSTELEILFLFLAWTASFWTTSEAASSWTWTSSSPSVPLAMPFPLFSFIVANPLMKKTKVNKNLKKKSDEKMMNEWTTLTSTSDLFVGKVLVSWLKTKSPNSKTMQGYQTMKRSIRVSMGSVNTIQI